MSHRNGATLRGCDVLPPMDPAARPAGARSKKQCPVGRFATINAFTDATLGQLCRAEIAVWLILWRDTQPNGLARTSQADLARRAGCNVSTVKRALRRLGRARLVVVVRRGRIGKGPSTYRVRPVAD
jgi:Helix-turn-helix domain